MMKKVMVLSYGSLLMVLSGSGLPLAHRKSASAGPPEVGFRWN